MRSGFAGPVAPTIHNRRAQRQRLQTLDDADCFFSSREEKKPAARCQQRANYCLPVAQRRMKASKAARASALCSCATKWRPSSSMRAMISSRLPRTRSRAIFSACCGLAASRVASASVSASTCSGATTFQISPACNACSAEKPSPIASRAKARWCPMSFGTSRLEAASGTSARSTKGVLNRLRPEATVRSQCRFSVVPMPMASPSTPETSGFSKATSAFRSSSAASLPFPPDIAKARKSAMSLPAEKQPSVPRKATTRMSGLALAALSASAMRRYMASVMAFFFSGRLKRMVRTSGAWPTGSIRM
ncbi:hypothetical protein AT6N2_C1735 [Agrobacterium tumefaciens]|nr:hypothetical protein AT6N2_C1735 [Agrobacterium tumefaciens]